MSTQALDKDWARRHWEYHRHPTPARSSFQPRRSSPARPRWLLLAPPPGAIVADPAEAATLTARQPGRRHHHGTAVLGLGNIGPLAAKPVMEGKACLFNTAGTMYGSNSPRAIPTSSSHDRRPEPTLGELEDIKAPDDIEQKVRASRSRSSTMTSTARRSSRPRPCSTARRLRGHRPDQGRLFGRGRRGDRVPGPDGPAGVKRENVYVCDSKGVIFVGRETWNKARYAQQTSAQAGRHRRRQTCS